VRIRFPEFFSNLLVLLCYKLGTFILSFLALMNTGQYVEVMNNRQPDFSRQLGACRPIWRV